VPVERIRFVATSASRDAENREDFVRGVTGILGVEPEVITGDQEAQFSFTGATANWPARRPADPVSRGRHRRRLHRVRPRGREGHRRPLGGHRLRPADRTSPGARRPDHRPAHPELVAAIAADVDTALDQAARAVPLDRARTLVGLAGSVTTIAGIALDLAVYDSAAIHHSRVGLEQVRAITTAS